MGPTSEDTKPDQAQTRVEKITLQDLKPEIPEIGGSVIVLQCNARDKRDPSSLEDFGALLPQEAQATLAKSQEFLSQAFEDLPEDQRDKLDVLVVASSTKLISLFGPSSEHQRGYETAEFVVEGIKRAMEKNNVNQNQLLNKTGKPIELTSERFNDIVKFKSQTGFLDFMREKYGEGVEFWAAYEADVEKEERIKHDVEGPTEIAKRMHDYITVLGNAARLWHEKHPDRRLIVWAVGHYDNLSPYIKEYITGAGATGPFMPIDKGSGIVLKTGPDHQEATTQIQGQEFSFPLTSAA